jgi:hypothetical protein
LKRDTLILNFTGQNKIFEKSHEICENEVARGGLASDVKVCQSIVIFNVVTGEE